MDRFPDWPERLGRALRERLDVPFAWGTNDCATFAADCVLAQTGTDFAEGLRGSYGDKAEALATLERMGHDGLDSLVDAFLPRRDGRPVRGDVVMLAGRLGDYLAISLGGDIAIAPADDRARQVRTSATGRDGRSVLIAAWAVG